MIIHFQCLVVSRLQPSISIYSFSIDFEMATTSPPPPYSPGYPSQGPVPSGYGYGQQPGVQSYQPQQQQQTNVVVVNPGAAVVTGNCPICRV